MSRPNKEIRDGKAWCHGHNDWHDFAQFDHRIDPNGTVRINAASCALFLNTAKDNARAADPAYEAIRGRAQVLAGAMSKAFGCTITTAFVWDELNYKSLVGPMRALIAPDGICQGCARDHNANAVYGDPSLPRFWHIAHQDPARSLRDLPRHHAENLKLRCPGDNLSQHQQLQASWVELNFQRWTIARGWAGKAGRVRGWPPYDPKFGDVAPPVILLPAQQSLFGEGNPT